MGKQVLGPVGAAGAGAAVQGFYCGLDLASPLRQDVSTYTHGCSLLKERLVSS